MNLKGRGIEGMDRIHLAQDSKKVVGHYEIGNKTLGYMKG